MVTVTVETLAQHINSGVRLTNMDLDLRADLVMCFGYDFEEVVSMSMDQVVRILDDADKEEDADEKYKNRYGIKCTKCGHEVGLEFVNCIQDYITSVCKCGHEDHYSEYHFDFLDEKIEFENSLNATMKKLHTNLEHYRVLSQHKNEERVNEIREWGYKIQQFETSEGAHEFYKLDDEYMYLRTDAVHGNTEVLQMVFKA